MMEEIAVNSSVISKLQYNPEKKQLVVKFKKGTNYLYNNIDLFVWNQFKNATSKGKFYSTYIKGKYLGTKF